MMMPLQKEKEEKIELKISLAEGMLVWDFSFKPRKSLQHTENPSHSLKTTPTHRKSLPFPLKITPTG